MQANNKNSVRVIFTAGAEKFADNADLLHALQGAGRVATAMLDHLTTEERGVVITALSGYCPPGETAASPA